MNNYYDDEFDYSTMRDNTSKWEDITEFEQLEMDDEETLVAVDKFLSKKK